MKCWLGLMKFPVGTSIAKIDCCLKNERPKLWKWTLSEKVKSSIVLRKTTCKNISVVTLLPDNYIGPQLSLRTDED